MTGDISDQGLPYRSGDRTGGLQGHDIEKIARVLSVQRGAELAGIKICRVEAQHLDEGLMGSLRSRAELTQDRGKQAAANDDARLRLDARARPVHEQLG